MATLILTMILLGFGALYYASGQVGVGHSRYSVWLHNHTTMSRFTGSFLLLVPALLAVYGYGIGAGLLLYFILLMTLGSLIIILAPIHIFNTRAILSIIGCTFILEYLFYAS